MSYNKIIPVCEPYLKGREQEYLNQVLKSGWISSAGKFIDLFEKKFAAFCGKKYGITTTNGTTALHLALLALGIKKGDEVIIPDFTMASTLFSVLYCQARPVFVDARIDTWNIDEKLIEKKITKKTKVIMPVHIYGHPSEMGKIMKIAKKYHLLVVEDAAEAHGAEYQEKKCGGFGIINCFSFYANKIITCGEGGMVVTSDKELAEKCRYYKNLCFPLSGSRTYKHNDLGYNFRLTNLQAAIGLAQLEKIRKYIYLRRRNAKLYCKYLQDIPGIQLPVELKGCKNVYWMFGIVIDKKKFGASRDELMAWLKERGIETRFFFKPMHSQPLLKKFGFFEKNKYPVSRYLAENGLYLPSGTGLREQDITYICQQIKKLYLSKK